MSLSKNIKRLRQAKGMTQEQLAGILGVSAQAVSKWETSDTYPDGALLSPLADALEASLDQLFGRTETSVPDIAARIWELIGQTPEEDQLHLLRALGWQMEKGLFNTLSPAEPGHSPEELISGKRSYILSEYGFTQISHGEAPFFSVFEEPKDGFGAVLGDGEEIRRIFAAASRPETMRAILFIHSKEPWYLMEDEVLGRECRIPPELLPQVIGDLEHLWLLKRQSLEVDGKTLSLYSTRPSHKMIALMLFAKELHYRANYTYQAHHRETPFIR